MQQVCFLFKFAIKTKIIIWNGERIMFQIKKRICLWNPIIISIIDTRHTRCINWPINSGEVYKTSSSRDFSNKYHTRKTRTCFCQAICREGKNKNNVYINSTIIM